ncbi:MAG: radical SAM protein [Kiritimatiellae bacterium]|nr:radical SAM protein [Kiritimatiellia bacterium]
MRYRFENFGGIVASEQPPFLAMVDRQFMRELGLDGAAAWASADASIGVLSAPTEVHLAATNVCAARCPHCYMDAGPADPGEMPTDRFRAALRTLAEFGVFHVALGGGEALARPDLIELAGYARELGLVPNLTVSGALLTPELAARMTVFGQVNVSIDGVGPLCSVFRRVAPAHAARGTDGHSGSDSNADPAFATADRALDLLLAAGVPTGINCVVGCRNFDGIPALFQYAAGKGVNEIEFLRYKPVGRAAAHYARERTTDAQNRRLFPLLSRLSAQYGLTAKIDCSFIPMLCEHNPSRAELEATGTYGCEAGNVLVGIRSDGQVSGCSFLEPVGKSVFDLPAAWAGHEPFQRLRTWPARAPEPCRSCPYLAVCKGGCHAVAKAVCGSADRPDPDCPRVVRYEERVRDD